MLRFSSEKEVLNMAKKLKKVRKGMSPKAKFTLASSFKGLISNQACIDGSRASAWWVAAIFLAFSTILPLLPTLGQLSKLDGASFISVNNYDLDKQLAHFAFQAKQNKVEFKAEGGLLHYYKDGVCKDEEGFKNPQKIPGYLDNYECEWSYLNTATNQIDLKMYFWVDENLQANINTIIAEKLAVKTHDKYTGAEGQRPYLPNIVIFTPTTMAVCLFKIDTDVQAAVSNGGLNWVNTPATGLVERLIGDADLSKGETFFVNEYSNRVISNFRGICTETYLAQKSKTKWTNLGIYFAIYVGVVLFLGLMVFILTRGKRNPYNFLNIWECQKISWWASASPAIIGTLLSLIFGGNAIGQMAFILVVSLRVMWLSMKQLRPVVQ